MALIAITGTGIIDAGLITLWVIVLAGVIRYNRGNGNSGWRR